VEFSVSKWMMGEGCQLLACWNRTMGVVLTWWKGETWMIWDLRLERSKGLLLMVMWTGCFLKGDDEHF
jgi:hypothetical protein